MRCKKPIDDTWVEYLILSAMFLWRDTENVLPTHPKKFVRDNLKSQEGVNMHSFHTLTMHCMEPIG